MSFANGHAGLSPSLVILAVVEERLTHREQSTLLRYTPVYGATFWHDCGFVIWSWRVPIQNGFLAVEAAMPGVALVGAQGRGTGTMIFTLVKGHLWGLFSTAACRPIVPLPPMSSPHSSPEAPRTT